MGRRSSWIQSRGNVHPGSNCDAKPGKRHSISTQDTAYTDCHTSLSVNHLVCPGDLERGVDEVLAGLHGTERQQALAELDITRVQREHVIRAASNPLTHCCFVRMDSPAAPPFVRGSARTSRLADEAPRHSASQVGTRSPQSPPGQTGPPPVSRPTKSVSMCLRFTHVSTTSSRAVLFTVSMCVSYPVLTMWKLCKSMMRANMRTSISIRTLSTDRSLCAMPSSRSPSSSCSEAHIQRN